MLCSLLVLLHANERYLGAIFFVLLLLFCACKFYLFIFKRYRAASSPQDSCLYIIYLFIFVRYLNQQSCNTIS